MLRYAFLIFLHFVCYRAALAQEDTAASEASSFLMGLELHDGMERGSRFLSPTLQWEKGLHRIGLGGVLGNRYQVKAGSRGRRWVQGNKLSLRGGFLSYSFGFWQASERVQLRTGLFLYLMQDAYRKGRGTKDPTGKEYGHEHKAARRSWGAAPSLMVEFDAGSGFSLALGFQPFRYQRASFRWNPKSGAGFSGTSSEYAFFFKQFEVKYRL